MDITIKSILFTYTLNYLFIQDSLERLYPNMRNVCNISKLTNSYINVGVSIIICTLYLITYDMSYIVVLRKLSIGFYLYDLIIVLKRRQYVFIVHHLLTIYSMNKWLPRHGGDTEGNLLVIKYLILETGNLFIYRVSYKKYIGTTIMLDDLILEFYNMMIRIIVAFYCICIVKDNEKVYVLMILLSGTLLWTKNLIIQIMNEIKQINIE